MSVVLKAADIHAIHEEVGFDQEEKGRKKELKMREFKKYTLSHEEIVKVYCNKFKKENNRKPTPITSLFPPKKDELRIV